MNISVLHEDAYLLVIDKPAGIIVHEGAGNSAADPEDRGEGTQLLTDWISDTYPDIIREFENEEDMYFRPGIVHRLDKDTSGLMLIAKTPAIKAKLQALFKEREVIKEYTTLVFGKPDPASDTITTFISRDPRHRRQMAVSFVGKGKEAITDYHLVSSWQYRYKGQSMPLSLITVTLHSGRMHQIRVHMKHKGWPVIGDQTYQTKPSRNISKELGLARQFLHAHHLSFIHPETGDRVDVLSPLPEDLQPIIDRLEKDNS